MAEKTSQTIYIEADPGTVLDVIADIDSYPEWISEYKEAEVQERGADGYPKVVRFVMDAGVIKDTINVAENTIVEVDFIADNPGSSLVHCHMQQHMDFGFKALVKYY